MSTTRKVFQARTGCYAQQTWIHHSTLFNPKVKEQKQRDGKVVLPCACVSLSRSLGVGRQALDFYLYGGWERVWPRKEPLCIDENRFSFSPISFPFSPQNINGCVPLLLTNLIVCPPFPVSPSCGCSGRRLWPVGCCPHRKPAGEITVCTGGICEEPVSQPAQSLWQTAAAIALSSYSVLLCHRAALLRPLGR